MFPLSASPPIGLRFDLRQRTCKPLLSLGKLKTGAAVSAFVHGGRRSRGSGFQWSRPRLTNDTVQNTLLRLRRGVGP